MALHRKSLAASLAIAAVLALTPIPAAADPGNSDDAKTAWIAAAQGVEELNQAVLQAEQNVETQQDNAAAAQAAAEATLDEVAAADAQVAVADAALAVYRPKLDAFANASLRGARLSTLSSLLTAESATDYLDKVTALDKVAADTIATMSAATDAKATADTAKATADGVRAAAEQAAVDAEAAVLTAQQAADDLSAQQDTMRDTIVQYEALYTSLSLAERGAAIEDFENSNLSPEALALLDAEAADRAAAGITDQNLSAMSVKLAPDTAAGIAVAAALTRRGLPYVWGAVGPDSFDCSGLMLWAWDQAGISIPRTSAEQAALPEIPMDEIQPGDLITMYSPVRHVGMYIGNGLIVHASMAGVPVKVIPLEKAGSPRTAHRVPR